LHPLYFKLPHYPLSATSFVQPPVSIGCCEVMVIK
jgi:hypothetical protein